MFFRPSLLERYECAPTLLRWRWADKEDSPATKPAPLTDDWMRVAPGTDAAIWRPWSRETGEL